jgi:hypothetical protein
MTALLLAIVILAAQGIPVLPNQTGTITGSLRTTAGTPAAGVRVSALAKPEALAELNESSSLAGIAETGRIGTIPSREHSTRPLLHRCGTD